MQESLGTSLGWNKSKIETYHSLFSINIVRAVNLEGHQLEPWHFECKWNIRGRGALNEGPELHGK